MPLTVPPLPQRIAAPFDAQLDRFSLQTLEQERGAIYALDRDLRLCYLNPAWYTFAWDNQGEPDISQRFPVGTPLTAAIQGPLRDFYADAYRQVLHDGQVWEHNYECASDTIFRRFHQRAYPIDGGHAVVVVNNLVVSHPYQQEHGPTTAPNESSYRNSDGLIVQCSHCRRVQHADSPDRWDWVPAWVAKIPPRTSHSLCYPCYEYFYRLRRPKAPT